MDYERILQSKEYIALEKKYNAVSQTNNILWKLFVVFVVFSIVGFYLFFHSSKELKIISQQLDNAYSLNLDAQTSYYSGYLEGKSAASASHSSDLSKVQRQSYESGYSSAMIDMESENDYADAYVDGYEDGWSAGYEEGYSTGYDDGYEFGNDPSYDDGYEDGYEDGYYDGLND